MIYKHALETHGPKPVIPKSRKTVERAKKPAAKDAVKKVEKGFQLPSDRRKL
jgi:hypothetical protein